MPKFQRLLTFARRFMGLGHQLNIVANTYLTDVRLIGDFISDAEDFLINKLKNKKPEIPFTAEEAKQLRALAEAAEKSAERVELYEKNKKAPSKKEIDKNTIRIEVSNRVSDFALQLISPIKQRDFLAEMSLSYLISHQEAFIKDYLFQLLIHKHNLLKSGATISYEEMAKHHTMRTLWSTLAQKEVDSLGYGSIDDVATYFSKKLNIELSTFKNWDALREHNFRRNLIIHNRGKINDTYRKKTGSKQKSGNLVTNIPYVVTAVANITNFIEFIHASVSTKFQLKTKPLSR